MKQKLQEFIENCIKIKNHDGSANPTPIKGNWKELNYYGSFGKDTFAYVPWLGFFAYNQIVTKGIYPVILYNTKSDDNNLEICYGVSAKYAPDNYWNTKYIQNLTHSNTPQYAQSYIKKSYTINSVDDLEQNIDDILKQLDSVLNDFKEQFNNKNSEEQLLESLRNELLKHYKNLNFNIDDTPNDYTAIKNKNNIAEVHRINSKSTKFKVVINYDKLPEEMKDNCKRVPDSYGWTLNGECYVTSRDSLDNVIRKIDSTLIENNDENHEEFNEMDIPLNQILYGPPGTGKTYNTIIKAMEIINPSCIQYDNGNVTNYDDVKIEFNNYKKTGQIEFVTFHQSYSYEEFVEGIKPDLNGDNLGYKLENGIFKNICEHAKPIATTTKHAPIDFSNTKVFKMSLGNTLEKEDDIYDYCIENNVVSLGWKDTDFSNCKTSQDFKSLDNSWGATALERFVKWMDIGDIIIISNGNMNFRAIAQVKSDYFYDNNTPISHTHFRKVEWLYKGEDIHYSKINNKLFSQQSIYGYFSTARKGQPDYNPDLKTDELNKIITGEINKEVSKPHILIIDEINRGNISKIFGELITLIEEDKRENLSVTLPYSKETFSVPKNLYIIGTMNTSDRSIASIDIALRRRFKFKEMMPKKELVADFGIGFGDIFEKLNTNIKILLDRDHQIGHSYFIKTKYENADINVLKTIWFSEIMPLLNEYFYLDWEKLKLIIPGFINKSKVPDNFQNECDEFLYEFKTFDEVTDFETALKQEKFE